MQIAKSILFILCGAAAGIAFVISRGDNWHLGADAAVDTPKAPMCDCPAAEPRIPGRLRVYSSISLLDSNTEGSVHILCSLGGQPISGNCTVDNFASAKNVILKESGRIERTLFGNKPAWRCSYRNNESTQISFSVGVVCLEPSL